jgi:two-component system phosphate regulon sensor histidine kinase PhoR
VKLGVRGKLFGVSVGLILAVVLASGFYLQGELRGLLEARIKAELVYQARSARAVLELTDPPLTIAALDPLADRVGAESEVRISLVAADGRLLGDSQLTADELASIENHENRPEIRQALAGDSGSSLRYSTTIGAELLYVAIPFEAGTGSGVVRVARPLAEVDQAVDKLRVLLLAAGFVGLLVAVFMSGLASHFMSRTLRRLVDTARGIAGGDPGRRIAVTTGDELAGLAGSLNQMAEDIEKTVEELASERARFKAVLESLTDAVIALDKTQQVVLMNRGARKLLGLGKAPEGTPILELVRAPALQQLIAEPDQRGTAEFDLPGTDRRVMVRQSPMQRGSVLVMQDVTEIRRLETVRRDFVANVSHELRTPVSIVRANAETLLDGAMNDPVHGTRLLEATLRNSERLSAIITDLLDLSRLEAGRYAVASESVPVAEVAARAVEASERKAAERNMLVEVDLPADLMVLADDKALEQILLNFLENAIKYTPEHGRIEVTAHQLDGQVRIDVSDNGPGIEPRHRARVFERFYRIDPGRSRDMGGTGLGLAIVRHLAEAMHGTVGVDPVEPHGSCFWIMLRRGDAAV